MANLDNQSKKRYYPLRDAENPYKVSLVEITEAQYRALYPEIWATQKRELKCYTKVVTAVANKI